MSSDMSFLELNTPRQATVSSKAEQNLDLWRAQGTYAVTTPCSVQHTRGALATTYAFVLPMSRQRHLRVSLPLSYLGDFFRQIPQRY